MLSLFANTVSFQFTEACLPSPTPPHGLLHHTQAPSLPSPSPRSGPNLTNLAGAGTLLPMHPSRVKLLDINFTPQP